LLAQDGKPSASYQMKIRNSGGSTANVSGFTALLSGH
jgi:hypothetical protein